MPKPPRVTGAAEQSAAEETWAPTHTTHRLTSNEDRRVRLGLPSSPACISTVNSLVLAVEATAIPRPGKETTQWSRRLSHPHSPARLLLRRANGQLVGLLSLTRCADEFRLARGVWTALNYSLWLVLSENIPVCLPLFWKSRCWH